MTDTTKTQTNKTRANRTPAERAKDALEAALARHTRARENSRKADERLQAAQKAAQDASHELQQSAQMIEYAKKHPDLPESAARGLTGVSLTTGQASS